MGGQGLLLSWWLVFLGLPEPLPPLADLDMFPPQSMCKQHMNFNRHHQSWLTSHRDVVAGLSPHLLSLHDTWMIENDFCWTCWNLLDDAWVEGFDEVKRRQALANLKHVLGPEAYYSGAMPPAVPVWRFQRR